MNVISFVIVHRIRTAGKAITELIGLAGTGQYWIVCYMKGLPLFVSRWALLSIVILLLNRNPTSLGFQESCHLTWQEVMIFESPLYNLSICSSFAYRSIDFFYSPLAIIRPFTREGFKNHDTHNKPKSYKLELS